MDSIGGILLVPPERGQILGRAVWKPRYVVVSRRGSTPREQPTASYPHKVAPSRTFSNSSKIREPLQMHNGEYMIAVYKSKDDNEPYYQCPVNSVTDCQVQQVSHRKQGPVLPTLVITVADKEKKRRSSRAAGLISSKESTQSTMWFRTPPDDHHYSLHEWRHFILSRKLPMSPESPVSPTFVNPFAPRSDARPQSGNQKRSTLSHLSQSRGYAHGERECPPTAYGSESPSLRSKRSDVSSPINANHPNISHRTLPSQHYTTVLPSDIPPDLPSPAESGAGDQHISELIEGWSSPQARSSSFSSPRPGAPSLDRRHTSVGVSPTINRETILDRAFQLRCIPGSERAVPGEEKLSSLARFDALMRETEDRRKKEQGYREKDVRAARRLWEMGGDSSESDDEPERETDDEDDDYHLEQEPRRPRRDTLIPPATQRALEFITGRYDRPQSPRTPHSAALPPEKSEFTMAASDAHYRPHTSYSRKRPDMSSRTQSQPHLLHNPTEMLIPPMEEPAELEKQQSSNSTKRLSFTDITKRLSSTSSLLLVQTNTSGPSSRGSSELDYHPVPPLPRSSLGARSAAALPNLRQPREVDERDKRCGWRSSVGVIGGPEGGFV
ncbi:hypothetical protein jhhlp_008715 [Lomentospora prolificans]|uniref:Uncharacterized protein n=1 Tax=Lomentospora prolificans TaxID=41688 RepID=A0A2N3MYT3_9PEZI|nr:hypothetical protein jhhlp_008715 [Lomentospora prolificans]